jgi:hypothetical protein
METISFDIVTYVLSIMDKEEIPPVNIFLLILFRITKPRWGHSMVELKISLATGVAVFLLAQVVLLTLILVSEDDLVVISVSFSSFFVTSIILAGLIVYLRKYHNMEYILRNFLERYPNVPMDKAIPGYSSHHIEDITEDMIDGLETHLDVS